MVKDPIEETQSYQSVVKEVDQEVERQLSDKGIVKARGYIHHFWNLKKQILKEKYNLDWKSPKEMNPEMVFD